MFHYLLGLQLVKAHDLRTPFALNHLETGISTNFLGKDREERIYQPWRAYGVGYRECAAGERESRRGNPVVTYLTKTFLIYIYIYISLSLSIHK